MSAKVDRVERVDVAAYRVPLDVPESDGTSTWDHVSLVVVEVRAARLLGQVREDVPIYASGGFTSMSVDALTVQLGDWVGAGIPRVKMKIGREPERDLERVRAARAAIGDAATLFVDANGGYRAKRALELARGFAEQGVTWFEEPVSSDDLEGLRSIRDRAPASVEIAAGEYGCDPWYFRRMLDAGAVDVLQLDGTRALGVTGALRVDALCLADHIPLSLHTAPAFHLHLGAALDSVVHVEWFHDHVEVEQALFEGAPVVREGVMQIDASAPGNGLRFRAGEAKRHAI